MELLARSKGTGCAVIPCGGCDSTLDDFKIALRTHTDAFNILLVDAEASVVVGPRLHLSQRDGWDVSGIAEDQCHLMVQMMEAWFLADKDALGRYFDQQFNASALPQRANVEEIPKDEIESALEKATFKTQKGRYHKTKHGPHILKSLDAAKVRKAAAHCDRLFATIEQKIQSA